MRYRSIPFALATILLLRCGGDNTELISFEEDEAVEMAGKDAGTTSQHRITDIYDVSSTIVGRGAFSKVVLAVNRKTGQKAVIKVMNKKFLEKANVLEKVASEIEITESLSHPNIIRHLHTFYSTNHIYIFFEYASGGEIFTKLKTEGRVSEEIARRYFAQLIDGLEYCHKRGIAHRDIKPENLLLDHTDTLKIIDFGLAARIAPSQLVSESTAPDSSNLVGTSTASIPTDQCRVTPNKLLNTQCGSPNYIAPEVLRAKGYDGFAADIWSVGVVLYVFIAAGLPFDSESKPILYQKINKAEYSFPEWFSEEAKDLIRHILKSDPKQRFTIAQIRSHPWFTQGQKDRESVETDIPLLPTSADTDEPLLAMQTQQISPDSARATGTTLAQPIVPTAAQTADVKLVFDTEREEEKSPVITRPFKVERAGDDLEGTTLALVATPTANDGTKPPECMVVPPAAPTDFLTTAYRNMMSLLLRSH